MEILLVSITDAANALSLGRTSIYELMRSGELESRKMGRRRLITAASLRRLIGDQDEGQAMKRINPRLAKLHRSYTAFELADLLGVHKNSVRHWIKQGLPALDGARPTLICGSDFQAWWGRRCKAAKRPCQPGQMFCFKCREPQVPALGMVEYAATNATTGNLKGMCETCGTMMHRRTRLADIASRMPGLDVHRTQAPPSIDARTHPSPNCDNPKGP